MSFAKRYLFGGVALCLALAACGTDTTSDEADDGVGADEAADDGSSDSDQEEPEDVIEVSFGASGMPSSIGLLAAIIEDEGYAEAHGLDLTVREFAPDQAEQAILTGQVDTGFFAVVALANVREEGQDVVFLRPLQANHGAVIVRDDSDYDSLEDLQGQSIATLTPVSGLYTSMQVLAAELGLDWESDFDIISGPPPGLISFIETGEVEGIVHFEPSVSSLLASGDYRAVMTPTEAWEEQTGAPLFMLGLAARESWVEDNPEAARRLVAVFDDLLEGIDSDPEIIRNYQEDLGLSDEAMDIAVERMSDIYIPESIAEVEDNVRLILERSQELGVIAEVPDRIFVDLDD